MGNIIELDGIKLEEVFDKLDDLFKELSYVEIITILNLYTTKIHDLCQEERIEYLKKGMEDKDGNNKRTI